VLVFDGLDEVTHITQRQRVIDEITALVEKADASDADLLIIATTRPTGYTERLLPQHFEQIDLDYQDFFINHRLDITELHQKVGLLLQIQCEGNLRDPRPYAPR
jgi:hypothetical protein